MWSTSRDYESSTVKCQSRLATRESARDRNWLPENLVEMGDYETFTTEYQMRLATREFPGSRKLSPVYGGVLLETGFPENLQDSGDYEPFTKESPRDGRLPNILRGWLTIQMRYKLKNKVWAQSSKRNPEEVYSKTGSEKFGSCWQRCRWAQQCIPA